MTDLVVPDVRWHVSWAETLRELLAEGHVPGFGLGDELPSLDREGCAACAVDRRRFADRDEVLDPGLVHCDFLWITEADEVIGFLALRHALTPWLLDQGGHIGYSVRPSRRRQGHASRAVRLALVRAAELGLDRVLITCDEDNLGSRRTIERSGGVYEDTRGVKRRYWVDLAPAGRGVVTRATALG